MAAHTEVDELKNTINKFKEVRQKFGITALTDNQNKALTHLIEKKITMPVLSLDDQVCLSQVANEIVAPGKGLLAADEKAESMGRRFQPLSIENTEENRRRYREMLFSVDNEISKYLGGIILTHEAFYQKNTDGVPFYKVIKDKGIKVGITPDKGQVPMPGFPGETTTQGLDGLSEKLAQYKRDGAEFCKWYCGIKVGPGIPSYKVIWENANTTARYAATCQQNGLVPIVEPAVECDGDHDLETAQKVTEQVMSVFYKLLMDHHVFLEGTLLKPSMVVPGLSCTQKYSPEDVGKATVTAFSRSAPVAVPGIAFLSGGLSEEICTVYLNAVNKTEGKKPWPLTFCFGRALQGSVMRLWDGKDEHRVTAQKQFLKLAKANSEASLGKFESA